MFVAFAMLGLSLQQIQTKKRNSYAAYSLNTHLARADTFAIPG